MLVQQASQSRTFDGSGQLQTQLLAQTYRAEGQSLLTIRYKELSFAAMLVKFAKFGF